MNISTLETPLGAEDSKAADAPAILLLEDQLEIRELVTGMLRIRGHSCDAASSLAEARRLMTTRRYEIILADVTLPDGSGLSLVEERRWESPLVVVMTGSSDIQTAVRAIRTGAIDFITKPFTIGDFLGRVDKAVEEWRARRRLAGEARQLEAMVKAQTEKLLASSHHIEDVHDKAVLALGAALNLKDHETADHCARVSANAVALGRILSLPEAELKNLQRGAYLHDVGKIGIPERILLKDGPLTPEERVIMQKHPEMGHELIHNIDFLGQATDVVLSHHEQFDGSGYPRGLRGTEISLHARIFSIMDALDAMTSDRPYRAALPVDTAAREVAGGAASQFDPEIVKEFLAAPRSLWRVQAGRGEEQDPGVDSGRDP